MKHLKLPITILVALLTFSAFAGLETFTGKYIADLVATNPVGGTDPQSEGDDHIRGIKLVLQNTFANVNGAVTSTDEELNYVDVATLGTTAASKAWTADASNITDVTGDVTFDEDVTLGDASGDVITVTGTATVATPLTLQDYLNLSEAGPNIRWVESGVTADNTSARMIHNGEELKIQFWTDDFTTTSEDIWIATRTATVADSIISRADIHGLYGSTTEEGLKVNPLGGSTSTYTTLALSQTGNVTLTLPDATDTLVGRDTTDTLTNKTLTSPTINGTQTLGSSPVLAAAANLTIKPGAGGTVTLGASGSDFVTVPAAFTTNNGTIIGSDSADGLWINSTLYFEGATADANELTLAVPDVTSDKTLTLPDATDTLVGKATTDTLTNKTFDANGTGNSLSNVDVADLANGTAGNLITWDAVGAPAVVATGTAGQVLTSNGAGAAPTFQAKHSLKSAVATTSGDDIAVATGISGATHVIIVFDRVSVSGTDSIQLYVGYGGTPTYISTGYDATVAEDSAAATNATSHFPITNNGATGYEWTGHIHMTHMGSNLWAVSSNVNDTASSNKWRIGAGIVDMSANELTALRVSTSGSNTFDNGQIRVHYY